MAMIQPAKQRLFKTLSLTALTLVASLGMSSCSQINRMGANIALGFAEKYVAPPILSVSDTNMACESSNAMTPLIVTTQAMGANAAKLGVLMYSGAALCAEDAAINEELRFMRASDAGSIEEAQDARIAQKRWSGVAAYRQYEAYKMYAEYIESKQKIKLGEDCPKLRTDMDQTIYLLGLLSGLQAVQNDVASQNVIGVPKDIAAKVERGMTCLDNEKYWGAPLAIRAAIWSLLPGADIGKPDPFLVMKQQAQLGEKKGVRLAHAVYAMAAAASGDDAKIRDAIRTYGESVGNVSVNPEYRLFDEMGGTVVRNVSDRYWTENTGKRTPLDDGMIRFWDEEMDMGPSVEVDLSDIL